MASSTKGSAINHKKSNDELRDDREGQEERRQELRDEAFEMGDGARADEQSQDARRHEGDERA